MPGNETLIVRLAPELKAKARRYAELKHTTLSQVVRDALVKFVADEEAAEAAARPDSIVTSGGLDIPLLGRETGAPDRLADLLHALLEVSGSRYPREQAKEELNPETENG